MAKKSWLSKYLKSSSKYKVNPRTSPQKKRYLQSIRSATMDRGRGSGSGFAELNFKKGPRGKAFEKATGYDPNSRKERIYQEIGKFSQGEIQKAQRALGIKEVRGRKAGRQILKYLAQGPKVEKEAVKAKKPKAEKVKPEVGKKEKKNPLDKKIKNLLDTITGMKKDYKKGAKGLKRDLKDQKKYYEGLMDDMQGDFKQAMMSQVDRPQVEGIRFADVGTGGATRQQLARRGMVGTFGRTGQRLMKISSLNL